MYVAGLRLQANVRDGERMETPRRPGEGARVHKYVSILIDFYQLDWEIFLSFINTFLFSF